jgi:hypothetical protein
MAIVKMSLQELITKLQKELKTNKFDLFDYSAGIEDDILLNVSNQNKKKIKILNLFNTPDLSMNIYEFKRLISILEDEEFKNHSHKETKLDLEILKLIKAREEDFDFEKNIANIICGDNTNFPYRSGYYLTEFFKELGLNYEHDGSTRALWVTNVLRELNTVKIHEIITTGVFKRKYFIKSDKDIEIAKQEFKNIIEESCRANEAIDLSNLFGLNIQNELLFNKDTKTSDSDFNNLVDKSKEFFAKGDKQTALEKIWDAFERLKTLINNDKRIVSDSLISLGSEIEKQNLDAEFNELTSIGNNYQIRHFETDKKPITKEEEKTYLYFRVLSLIDFSLSKLNQNKAEL